MQKQPQFIHIEAYSRAGSARKPPIRAVLGEADRSKGYANHVLTPFKPVWHIGDGLGAIESALRSKNGVSLGITGRSVAKTRLTLLAGVAGFPNTGDEIAQKPELFDAYERWRKLTIDFLKAEYGDRLVAVCEHDVDEPRPHLHFFCVPRVGPKGEFSATALHPGLAAKRAAERAGAKGPEMRQAYCDAMRAFQQRFHAAVGAPMGWSIRSDAPRARRTREEQELHKRIEATERELARLKTEQSARRRRAPQPNR